jgi:NAD(P)-dependent dehydrogenase (short-subunit alcohol dehydrogenase family)
MRFQGKSCIVTGGGSGIGRATCLRLAAEGAGVTVIDIDPAGAQRTVDLIGAAGGSATAVTADVSSSAQVKAAVDRALARTGAVDVLVNNAAIMTFKPIVELAEEDWDRVLAVNLRSLFLFCRTCLPHMRKGAIVNISSVHAHETTARVVPYAASKGGIEAFTRALSREVPMTTARVNSVAPGAIDTPMLHANPNVRSGAEHIEGKIGRPEDVASAVCYLAGPEAEFINGSTVVVDGGRLTVL